MKFVRVNDPDRPWEVRAAGDTTRGVNDVFRDDQVFESDESRHNNDSVMGGALPAVESEDVPMPDVDAQTPSEDIEMEEAVAPTPVPSNSASNTRPSRLPIRTFELSTQPLGSPKRKRTGIPQPASATPQGRSRKRLKSYRRGGLLRDEMPRSLI